MEHVIITNLDNGFIKVVADSGYLIKYGNYTYSEVIVKNLNEIQVISKPED